MMVGGSRSRLMATGQPHPNGLIVRASTNCALTRMRAASASTVANTLFTQLPVVARVPTQTAPSVVAAREGRTLNTAPGMS